jgi:hypothetical protein
MLTGCLPQSSLREFCVRFTAITPGRESGCRGYVAGEAIVALCQRHLTCCINAAATT